MVNQRQPVPRERDRLLWRPAVGAALLAGMLALVGTLIPIVPIAMLCTFASGGLAVTLYRRRAGHPPVSPWMGAKLGVMAGGFVFGLLALLSTVGLLTSSGRSQMREVLNERVQQAAAKAADPQVQQAMERVHNFIATDRGLVVSVLVSGIFTALFFLIVSALGGTVGAFLFGRQSAQKEP